MTKKQYPVGEVSKNRAWTIAGKLGKAPPYKGYALDLENGQILVNQIDGKFFIRDNVITGAVKELGL